MSKRVLKSFQAFGLGLFFSLSSIHSGFALELDWSGQFWSEFNLVHNYAMDASEQGVSFDQARANGGGYYVPAGGSRDTTFQSAFLRLRPKLVVNDNIYIKSEWWVGDPIFGIFGSAVPYSTDQRQYYSTQSRGSFITAQRFWGEFITDLGTLQVGRVPLHWGLGLIWNGGDRLWDRYISSGDAVRWIAKFGSFSVIPSFVVNSIGNSIGQSGGGVTDYSLVFRYENIEDEMEVGANLLKRLGGSSQDRNGGLQTPPQPAAPGPGPYAGSINSMTYDLYAKKKFSKVTMGAEVPITSGMVGGTQYQSFGLAGELSYRPTDIAEFHLKAGHAPGQPSFTGNAMDTYRAFYFNPNYHIAMIMFNYQLSNFRGTQTQNNPANGSNQLASPYNNPIVNATYFSLSSDWKPSDKWTLRPNFAYAAAPQASADGKSFFNYWDKTIRQNATGKNQGSSLGWEFDLGVTFQWDESFQFAWDNGVFVPGSFYAFSNTAVDNKTSPVFATSFRMGVNF